MKIRFRTGCATAMLAGLCLTAPVMAEDRDSDQVLPGQGDAQKDITITETSMQFLTGESHTAGVYFTIRNDGATAHLITNVSSPACRTLVGNHSEQESSLGTVALFTHLSLPAHTTLVFPHGGYHLLCLDMENSVQAGQTVSLTFTFLGGSSKNVAIRLDPAPLAH